MLGSNADDRGVEIFSSRFSAAFFLSTFDKNKIVIIMKKLFNCSMLGAGVQMHSLLNFAIAKMGAIVTDLKGSSGGTTFKGSKSGTSMQNKITSAPQGKSGGKITKADAGRVINTQRNQSSNVQLWKDLNSSERASWASGAVNFPFVNKFGDSYTPSGYQLFISVNNNLLNVGASTLRVCPSPAPVDDCPPFVITYSGGGTPSIATDITVPSGYSCIVSACAPQSSGRNFEASRLKAITILPARTTGTTSLTAEYEAIFGKLPSSGNIWFDSKITKADAGRQGLPYRFQLEY